MYSHHWDMYIYQITSFVPRQVHACHEITHVITMIVTWGHFSKIASILLEKLFLGIGVFFFVAVFEETYFNHTHNVSGHCWGFMGKLLTWQKLTRNLALCSTIWGGRFCFWKPLSIQISGVGCTKFEYTIAEYVSISPLVVVHCICTNLSFFCFVFFSQCLLVYSVEMLKRNVYILHV